MKFTIEEINFEHYKIKSGADFPEFIQAIKNRGVSYYTVNVADGNTEYFWQENHTAETGSIYENLLIEDLNTGQFKTRLKLHQQGKTDYHTFCRDCAQNGVKSWKMDLNILTCSYLDKLGNEILTEEIPA